MNRLQGLSLALNTQASCHKEERHYSEFPSGVVRVVCKPRGKRSGTIDHPLHLQGMSRPYPPSIFPEEPPD
jgi:hypothetical protein